MSLYADYKLEREGKHTIENENGFVIYQMLGADCYIEDIFVQKDFRKNGLASLLADQVFAIAKEAGCKRVLGSVATNANNPTVSMKALLGYGFKLLEARPNFIYLSKEVQ